MVPRFCPARSRSYRPARPPSPCSCCRRRHPAPAPAPAASRPAGDENKRLRRENAQLAREHSQMRKLCNNILLLMSKYTSTQKLNAANASSTAGNNNCFGESAKTATPLPPPAVLDLMPSCPSAAAAPVSDNEKEMMSAKLFGVEAPLMDLAGRRRRRTADSDEVQAVPLISGEPPQKLLKKAVAGAVSSTQQLDTANAAGNNNCFGESAEAATPLSLPAVLDLMPSCPGGAARIKQRRGNDEREKLFGVSIGRKRTRHDGGGACGEDEHAAVVKTESMDGRPPAAALALAARRGRERGSGEGEVIGGRGEREGIRGSHNFFSVSMKNGSHICF
uniref:Uncharacterized protein n=1 Tax=Oryza meridionalis TaxID=40149 RepID=A0A0E0D4A2_9ORYZ